MVKIVEADKNLADFIVECQIKMAKESEDYDLDRQTVQKGVGHIFEKPDKGFYLVAKENDRPIACMLVLYEWSDWRNGEVLWIHSLFVISEFRRKKVFTSFYELLKKRVENSTQLRGIRLYVEKNNVNAQLAYRSIGMTDEHYDMFEWLR